MLGVAITADDIHRATLDVSAVRSELAHDERVLYDELEELGMTREDAVTLVDTVEFVHQAACADMEPWQAGSISFFAGLIVGIRSGLEEARHGDAG